MPEPTITVQLSPAASKRLFLRTERLRADRGWTRERYAQIASAHLPGRDPITGKVLDQWSSKCGRDMVLRIDLDKAVALLAALGCASDRLDGLVGDLAGEVAALLDEAGAPRPARECAA